MKKTLIALLAVVAIPLSLSAGSYCSKCHKGSRGYHSRGKHQQYSQTYESRVKHHQDLSDYSVSDDDKRIALDIRERLQRSGLENPNEIQIFVEYGKVILEGKVTNGRQKQRAEQAALQVAGVRTVVNGIYVDNRESQQQHTTQANTPRGNPFYN